VPGRRREKRAPVPYPRTARVNEVLREVVADTIERMADTDDRLRLVTVTAVDVTPDLSRATVYLSSMAEPAGEALHAERVHLQREVARQVRLKRTPQLVFAPDPSVTHGRRVEEILRQLHAQRADLHEDSAPDDTGPGAAPGARGDAS
jgi:ribosome-binding factor A